MGGICGFITQKNISNNTIENMIDEIKCRGEKHLDISKLVKDKYNICIAQRLLNIESKNTKTDIRIDNYHISIDGEIYNFNTLKDKMIYRGYKCTDVKTLIIAMYTEYGIEFVKQLEGIFAIALYNEKENKLILLRDKIGKKPLYYSVQNEDFIFASELKSIMKYEYFSKEIRTEIICRYLCTNYINQPDTIFKNVFKLENGSYIIWNKGIITKGNYWNYLDEYKEKSKDKVKDFKEAKNELKKLIYESTYKRINTENSIGIYLSGGIDSSLVTAVSNDISKNKINTFSIGFHNSNKPDEAKFAKEISKYIGTNHNELYVSEEEMINTILDIPKYYDEPFADSSQIPSILINRLAKDKVDLVLTGDGADQIFCGSKVYDNEAKIQKLDSIFNILYYICNNSIMKDNIPLERKKYIYNRDKSTKTQFDFLRKEFDAKKVILCESLPARYEFEKDIPIKNWQEKRLILDMQTFLTTRLLTKVDRASINEGIELRMPLIDNKIVEYAFRIPHQYKYYKGEKKYILKQILYDLVPKELLDRPKSGFGIPLSKDRNKVLVDILLRFSNKNILEKQGIFNGDEIQNLIYEMYQNNRNLYQSILYPYLIFQLWYKEYIENLWD